MLRRPVADPFVRQSDGSPFGAFAALTCSGQALGPPVKARGPLVKAQAFGMTQVGYKKPAQAKARLESATRSHFLKWDTS
jgi:hypothetical protein